MSHLDVSLICNLQPFLGMKIDDMQQLLDKANSHHHKKGSVIFSAEEQAHSFFLLLDGHIRVMKINANGEQMVARYISPGELFGIAKAIGRETYPANAYAAVDCLSLAWPTHIWNDVISNNPSFANTSNQTVGDRLMDTQDRMLELATEKVERRVANAILKIANQAGVKNEDGILIDFPISRQDISELTGTTLHTVSRLMSNWESLGWVKSGRQKITLIEGHKLMLIATGNSK